MDGEVEETTDIAGARLRDPRPRTGWRRYWKFPKSWKEVKALGWKFVLAFVLFYLIRDSILYILIPYLIYKGVINP
ncbi:MAG: hypothetical protein NDJ18_01120 [candidate division Zixibacteria bacterium]|nr:hypothetical protein [candidate division Zixibacteria bacterium]